MSQTPAKSLFFLQIRNQHVQWTEGELGSSAVIFLHFESLYGGFMSTAFFKARAWGGDIWLRLKMYRTGSSPVPTHDPDLRSRPPIQTFREGFDPDLWNDSQCYWWVRCLVQMVAGYWVSCSAVIHPAKQPSHRSVVKPRCQAVKLPSCTCRKGTLPSMSSNPAAKVQLWHIQAVKLPSWHCCKL